MELRIKILKKGIKTPEYAYEGDAGMDLFSLEDIFIKSGERYTFWLGFACEFEKNFVALIWDKGGVATKKGLHTIAGVIDSGYRGEWNVNLLNISSETVEIKKGEKIAQAIFAPIVQPKIKIVKELNNTDRGKGCFGSSGSF
jgi:dUTP pyrophosphatase